MALPGYLKKEIEKDDKKYKGLRPASFVMPKYSGGTHYLELTRSDYFNALITLRHYFKIASDYYFGVEQGAKNIDLFMITPSVSSPMGPGSDSKTIPIKFGKFDTNLVDSSQFGFEPLLLNNMDKVYCYLPSMRGEDPDKRHLNQFFHCEAEIKGELYLLIPIIEDYIKILAETFLAMPYVLRRLSLDFDKTKLSLNKILELKKMPEIEFDDAVNTLVKSGNKKLVHFTKSGRDISAMGEIKVAQILNFKTPFWIKNYDRDRVPFYQKPDPKDSSKVINADLIFPPIFKDAFGGEVVGCGQRQNNSREIMESLSRQGIKAKPYEWYINLRKLPKYRTTSGFGLGVERFITWSLCHEDIKDAILYPRLKNVKTYP